MSTYERRKGANWESTLVNLLIQEGWLGAERAGGGHIQGHGDILGIPGWRFDAKNHSVNNHYRIGVWLDQMKADYEWRNVILAKRHGKADPKEGFAVMRIGDFLELLREAGY